jgi:exodeoxyribonuclease VII large subunit
VPVVCGVGHETDITLADLAADLRAATPTAAAELAAPVQAEALGHLETRAGQLQRVLQRTLQNQAQRLDTVALRLGQPSKGLITQRQQLDSLALRLRSGLRHSQVLAADPQTTLAQRLLRAARAQLQREPLRLQASAERLAAQDPARILRRGYAWIEALDGRPVLSVQALRQGQAVRAVWADGRATAEVLSVEPLPPTA